MAPTPIIAFPFLLLLLSAAIALLVLFIILCIKKPKLAAILVLAPLLCFVLWILLFRYTHRVTTYQRAQDYELMQQVKTAIWQPGIEDEFEADVYPSKISSVRSIGLRIAEQFQHIMVDSELPDAIVIFQNSQEIELAEELREVILKLYPEIKCRIETAGTSLQNNEVGIRFHFANTRNINVSQHFGGTLTSGTLQATISNENRRTNISIDYVEKPWIVNFSNFLNNTPNRQLIVAKSSESCLTQAEANQQAMENACAQVGPLLTNLQEPSKLTYNNILESGLIMDRFVQSFEGSAGKIWRQALLLDVSSQKLKQLADNIAGISRARRMTWARMFFSIAGLFLLITVVYAFLNAATKGYYAWSLRIAGIVLALIVIFLFLT